MGPPLLLQPIGVIPGIPGSGDGFDRHAPLSRWSRLQAFDTAAQCEASKTALWRSQREDVKEARRQASSQDDPVLLALEDMSRHIAAHQCVSGDDPRLTQRAPEPDKPSGPDRSRPPAPAVKPPPDSATKSPHLETTGTGFVVSRRGHILTNAHVVNACREIYSWVPVPAKPDESPVFMESLQRSVGVTSLVAVDAKNDLALLRFSSHLDAVASFRDGRGVRQGDAVVALGFPLPGLLASGANLTTGNVSALAGLGDDARYLQITAPVQPGNSGGPLLDGSGNVVGVVVGKLDAIKVARAIGDIPQNVNFAINANVARAFLDANGVDYALAPSTTSLQAADVGERAKKFTVVVECWK